MSRGFLVVGGDSAIGASVEFEWRRAGRPAASTSRRPAAADAGCLRLDLAESPDRWPDLGGFEAAVLCAGITQLDVCRRDPAGTRRVNVEATLELARRLAGEGCFVVFLSTNLVFDGSRPFCRPEDSTCPRTEYGRQKAAVEAGLAALGGPFAVVRLTKVFHAGLPLLKSWTESLRAGRGITAYSNYYCAPVALPAVVDVLTRILSERRAGIWHVSGPRDVAYSDLALLLTRRLGVASSLVSAVVRDSPAGAGEDQGLHTVLETDRTRTELGFRPEEAADVLAGCVPGMTP